MAVDRIKSVGRIQRPRAVPWRFAAALSTALILAASGLAAAQLDVNEVHILPRTVPVPPASTAQVIRSNVDLVLVNVTVLDRADRTVAGLDRKNFTVLDDNRPQIVRYLSNVDEPVSLVVVLDASASMATKIERAREAVKELVHNSNPQDDFSMVIVRNEPRVAFHSDDPASDMERTIDAIQPDGATALWDGMYLGMQELRNSRYRRKALVVISDGGDNHSRYTQSEVESLLKESDAEVYAIGMFDRYAARTEEKLGPLQLDEVTSVTGGRLFSVHDSPELSRAVTQIGRELRDQYVLGYYPSNRRRDGKWRKLKVRLSGLASGAKFRLYAKQGYYAPAE
ncbi:MAG TPA: VWA domain-containing protein [Terriglobales bacterium]|jgi:Ca-activated chloride channel family protein|nr:VWA domain-containing protein [Terriglobales bacterium]